MLHGGGRSSPQNREVLQSCESASSHNLHNYLERSTKVMEKEKRNDSISSHVIDVTFKPIFIYSRTVCIVGHVTFQEEYGTKMHRIMHTLQIHSVLLIL